MKKEGYKISEYSVTDNQFTLCETLTSYCRKSKNHYCQLNLFANVAPSEENDIRVVELFAGVGGFRIGLERASKRFVTIWNNQWEPETKKQDASHVYCNRFTAEGHSNIDINKVPVCEIPDHDLLVGGFPCQDYSVATTLKNSGGIQGKKGVLWWAIHNILYQKGTSAPDYLFLENVDRLLKSPATQRGRDFAIILGTLSDLGYDVEWRVINAADYGMPQRRRRTYIVAYRQTTNLAAEAAESGHFDWILKNGVIAKAFICKESEDAKRRNFIIEGDAAEITRSFNSEPKKCTRSPFATAGFMSKRHVWTTDVDADYDGPCVTLGELLVDESEVPEEFFISAEDFPRWQYLKGSKSEERMTKEGYSYHYSEGGMAFPDFLDRPSRTIITGEGGAGPSRFKHVVLTSSGRYRRLIPIELERLNMFPDNHTAGPTNQRRAFLMGNALVTGIVEGIGRSLISRM